MHIQIGTFWPSAAAYRAAARSQAPRAAAKQQQRQLEATCRFDTPLPICCMRLCPGPSSSHERKLKAQARSDAHRNSHLNLDFRLGKVQLACAPSVRAGAWFSLPLTCSRQPVLLRLLDGTSVDAPEAAAVSTSRRVRNHGPVDVKAVSPRRSAPLYAAFQGGPKDASGKVTRPTRTRLRRRAVVSTAPTEPGQRRALFPPTRSRALRHL